MVDLLDDDFWTDTPAGMEDLLDNSVLGTSGQGLPLNTLIQEHGRVLATFFPMVMPWIGFAKGTTPLACSILGSHLIGINESGRATWQQAIGTMKIPALNFANPHRGPKTPPLVVMSTKQCATPEQFHQWLNWVATKILQTATKSLWDAMNPDNFLPALPFACQTAHDIGVIGANIDMMLQIVPPNPLGWRVRRPHSYGVSLFAKGSPLGVLGLRWSDGRWTYGGQFTTQPVITSDNERLKFKHQAPSTLALDDIEGAKRVAERLFYDKMLAWLLDHPINVPF